MTSRSKGDSANRARALVQIYNQAYNGGDHDLETSAADLIADLIHLAEIEGWEFPRILRRALYHQGCENADPGGGGLDCPNDDPMWWSVLEELQHGPNG